MSKPNYHPNLIWLNYPEPTRFQTREKPLSRNPPKVFLLLIDRACSLFLGPINIYVCSPDGKLIQLKNSSKIHDIDLTGWRLLRKVDNLPEITYTFPYNLILRSQKYVKIYARGQGKESPPSELVLPTNDSWGVGWNCFTRLVDDQNSERSTFVEKTTAVSVGLKSEDLFVSANKGKSRMKTNYLVAHAVIKCLFVLRRDIQLLVE